MVGELAEARRHGNNKKETKDKPRARSHDDKCRLAWYRDYGDLQVIDSCHPYLPRSHINRPVDPALSYE